MSIALDMHAALIDLAGVFTDPVTARQVGQAMTCTEADTLAEAIALVSPVGARNFLRGHANGETRGDNPSDQHYHLRDDYDPEHHYYCGDDVVCLGCELGEDDDRHITPADWDESDESATPTEDQT